MESRETERARVPETRSYNTGDTALANSSELTRQLDYTLEQSLRLMRADGAAIWLADEVDGQPHLARHKGLSAPYVCEGQAPGGYHVRAVLNASGPIEVDIASEVLDGGFHPCFVAGLRSALYAPLKSSGRTMGVLAVYRKERYKFSPPEHTLLDIFASMAGLAIENERLHRAAASQLQDLKALATASAALNVPGNLRNLMQVIIKQATELMGLTASFLVLLDSEGQVVEYDAIGLDPGWAHDLAAASALARRVLAENRVMATWDLRKSDLPVDMRLAQSEGLVSALSAPLVHDQKPLGVIHVYSREHRAFDSNAVRLFHTFANQAATALENARLFDELVHAETQRRILEQSRARADTLLQLHQATKDLGSTLVLDEVLDRLCDSATQMSRADVMTVRMAGPTGSMTRLVRSLGFQELQPGSGDQQFHCVFAEVIETGRPVLVEDLAASSQAQTMPALMKEGIRSFSVFPLLSHGSVIGGVLLGYRTPQEFHSERMEGLDLLCHYAGAAIQNALFYEQERESQRAKDEFFSVITHELRTPLTVVHGYSQLLSRQLGPEVDPRLRRSAEGINEQTRRLREMVDSLLEISRIALGRFTLKKEAGDLALVVRQAAETLQVSTERHTILVNAPDTLQMIFDQQRIRQVLENLIGNAIKYSPAGGPIDVKVQRQAGEAMVAVRDYGVGIAPTEQPRIFERYYQVQTADGTRTGMGIGLNLCQEIVSAHGGRIWVESEPGKGSIFHFTLPAPESAQVA